MQDVSAGVLVSENVAAVQEVLWEMTSLLLPAYTLCNLMGYEADVLHMQALVQCLHALPKSRFQTYFKLLWSG